MSQWIHRRRVFRLTAEQLHGTQSVLHTLIVHPGCIYAFIAISLPCAKIMAIAIDVAIGKANKHDWSLQHMITLLLLIMTCGWNATQRMERAS